MSLLPYGLTQPTGFHPIPAYGLNTSMGTVLPAGGRVVAVVDNSSGSVQYRPAGWDTMRVQTLNAGLARCTAGQGDIVLVGPQHAEDISVADQMSSLKAGTQIIGLGAGQNRPTFTWTATASSFLLDVANVAIRNCILQLCPLSGTVSVATPLFVTAAGCEVTSCRINFGTDANAKVVTGITLSAAADDFIFMGNECFGATAAECTAFMTMIGTDRIRLVGNYISGATASTSIGLVRALTTAHTDGCIYGNYIANNKAAAEDAVQLIANCTGFMNNNHFSILSGNTIDIGNYTLGNDNTLANAVAERGLTFGTVST